MHEEKNTKAKDTTKVPDSAVPAYLLDREGQSQAKVLSNMIKQKRKEKAVSLLLYHLLSFYIFIIYLYIYKVLFRPINLLTMYGRTCL